MENNKVYKFTAGPWAISNNGKPTFGFYYIRQDPENWNGHGYQAIGRNVSELHASTKGTPYGEMFKANAILIASAPDLIKALDQIVDSSDIDEIKSIALKAIELAIDLEFRQLADYFDVEGADLLSPNSAFGHFNAHENKEITLAELKITAFGREEAVFIGIDADYKYYSVDADGDAWYTKSEPHLSERGDFWSKDISMKEAPNFNLHSDWKQSLIKRNSVEEEVDDLEVSTQ